MSRTPRIGLLAAAAKRSIALPIATIKVETTWGGEPVDVGLRQDGVVYLRLAPARVATPVARVAGSHVVALDGQVMASWEVGGRLKVRGDSHTMRLRSCTLVVAGRSRDDEAGEYTLRADGSIWLKPPHQTTFNLPAGVSGDIKSACPTALVLYQLLPGLLEEQKRTK